MEEVKRNLEEDLEQFEKLMQLQLGVHATQLQEIAGYWLPRLITLNKALVKVDSWNGQYMVNDAYRPIAEALVHKYEEIGHIKVNEILFIDNTSPDLLDEDADWDSIQRRSGLFSDADEPALRLVK